MKRYLLICVLLAAATLAGWAPALAQGAEPPEAAKLFCDRFFQFIDQGQYQESFALVAPVMEIKEREYTQNFSEREALGKASERSLSGAETVETFADLPKGQYLKIVYETKFETQPKAREIVVLDKLDNGEYGLAGYQVLYNRWPEAIRMIGSGLFIVFFIMALLAGVTWLVGRAVQSAEKAKKAREKETKEG